ncbi:MAG: VOC family protein [Bacteroidota bacterium]
MIPRIHIITLGVADLEKSRAFYRDGLGFPLSPSSQDSIAFFQLGGLVLSLYPYSDAKDEAEYFSRKSDGYGGIGLAHNCKSKDEVNEVIALAEAAGATIIKPPVDVFWGGYSGYFLDPDGHPWEVAWNPFFNFDENMNLQIG